MSHWRVWRAFERDPVRDDTRLWRALAISCKDKNGRVDVAEFDRWVDVFVSYRRGVA